MAAFKATLEGSGAMKRKLERAIEETPKELRKSLLAVAEVMLLQVQQRTPVKKGRILRSEKIRVMVSPKKEDLRISIVAGGPDAPHASIVHAIHKTKSLFLQSVILEHVPTIGGEIAQQLDLRRIVPAG